MLPLEAWKETRDCCKHEFRLFALYLQEFSSLGQHSWLRVVVNLLLPELCVTCEELFLLNSLSPYISLFAYSLSKYLTLGGRADWQTKTSFHFKIKTPNLVLRQGICLVLSGFHFFNLFPIFIQLIFKNPYIEVCHSNEICRFNSIYTLEFPGKS